MSDNNSNRQPSVYSLGASDGFWIGLAMGSCVVCIIMSTAIPILAYPALALFIATPFLAWRFLRRGWLNGAVPPTFSAVWLHGICIFLFGALIMALMMYITLRYISPGWIENQTFMAAQQLAANPETQQQSETLLRIISTGELPTPIYSAVSSIWLVAFTGSLWSMIFAFILTRTDHFRNKRAQNVLNSLDNQ